VLLLTAVETLKQTRISPGEGSAQILCVPLHTGGAEETGMTRGAQYWDDLYELTAAGADEEYDLAFIKFSYKFVADPEAFLE
jgi:hypothetical protein